jgi:hypothetical protein
MYLDEQSPDPASTGMSGGWQVDPDRVRDFVAAVEQIRADLKAIRTEVDFLSSPTYVPMLGTSPVGRQMSEKFVDRMGSEDGLRGLLDTALKQVEEFVTSAEKTAASYQAHDEDHAMDYRYS